MPFPLAHPAAVLPLRRLHPRYFNLVALVIGSLCPDAGYCLGKSELARFSHRPFSGAFGFCLPLGLLLVTLFYLLRKPVIRLLPWRYRRVLERLNLLPAGSPIVVLYSLLIGIWSHTFLDSITHRDGLFNGDIPVLHESVAILGHHFFVSDLAYALATFFGAAYVGLVCWRGIEQAVGRSAWAFPGYKWFAALTLGGMSLLLSLANHSLSSKSWLAAVGFATCLLILAFFEASLWLLRVGNGHGASTKSEDEPHVRKGNSNSTSKHPNGKWSQI